jgi:hypothetical protein
MTYKVYYSLRDRQKGPTVFNPRTRPHVEILAATPKAAHGRAAEVLGNKFDRFHISGIVGPFK